jgi:hypothetical protein
VKTAERIALLYGLSIAGAAAISYYRGRRGSDLLVDAALHGGVVGTGVNVIGFLVADKPAAAPVPVARSNGGGGGGLLSSVLAIGNAARSVGKLSKQGQKLLSQMPDELYSDFKRNGVKVAAIPENPNMVNQDAT